MPGYMPGPSPIPTGPQQPSVMGQLASATGQHFYNQLQALLSAAQLPGDVLSGQQNTQAFDPNTGVVGPDPTMLDRALTLASMPMSGGLGGAELGGGLLGAGPMRRIPAKIKEPKVVGGEMFHFLNRKDKSQSLDDYTYSNEMEFPPVAAVNIDGKVYTGETHQHALEEAQRTLGFTDVEKYIDEHADDAFGFVNEKGKFRLVDPDDMHGGRYDF